MDTTIDKHGFPEKKGIYYKYKSLSRDVNMSVQSVRTALKSFENHKMISVKSNKLSTKITLCNYDLFRALKKIQQTINKLSTNKRKVKGIKIKKEKGRWL